ncbi:hypothetical protein [Maricaulis sp.]|uniref:hypothetical protein n=1 Tax=Maricaulis sp. TaxID=1486257 RepID=UPI000C39410A|nr:hypothetical protein [Maricaulis sp.]MAC89382.1 hypothetical protein [Maricaulis sp.]
MDNFEHLTALVSSTGNEAEGLEVAFSEASYMRPNPRRIFEIVIDDLIALGCEVQPIEQERMYDVLYFGWLVLRAHDHPDRFCQLAFTGSLYEMLSDDDEEYAPVVSFKNRKQWRQEKATITQSIRTLCYLKDC